MKGAVGNWVTGEEFWGRDRELTELRELLDNGAHVLLVAPRRVGKTSLMRELGRRLEATHRCLFVDLEGAQSAADAIAELGLATRTHKSLWKRTQEVFRGLLDNVESIGAYELHPWDRDTATGFLGAIAESKKLFLGEGVAEGMIDRLGSAVPHHVQLYFDLVLQDARRRRASDVTSADAQRVFRDRMLSTRGHAELSHLEERLKMVLGPRRLPLALDLLTEAAVAGVLSSDRAEELATEAVRSGDVAEERLRDLLRELLGIFEHDGYLERGDDGYVFVSRLVRDWWVARFGYFHKKQGALR